MTMPPPNTPFGRETGGVSDLPPPLPPRTSSPTVAKATQDSGQDRSVDRLLDLAGRWYRPIIEKDGWLAIAYLLGSAVVAPMLFAVMATFGSLVFGLMFIVIGLLLVAPFFEFTRYLVRAETWLAGIAGHQIEHRQFRPRNGAGFGGAFSALTDSTRWRFAGFVALNAVMAPVLAAVGLLPVSFVTDVLFSGGADKGNFPVGWLSWVLGPARVPVAILAIGAAPRVAVALAGAKADFHRWCIGDDRLAAAEQRVETLSTQRDDILDAVANERRRIERNLHDGVQQQLVAIGLDLGMAVNHLDDDPAVARQLIVSAREKVQGSIGELRQLGRGLHPAILEDRGIDAALSAVIANSPIPISVHVEPDLVLATGVAETVYLIANEAVANVLKHAKARVASIHVTSIGDNVRVTIHDDGIGGASPNGGSGLAGIRARVNGADGVLTITSPVGGPTTITAEVPRNA